MAVRGVGELETKYLRVLFGLLEAVTGIFVRGLRLYDCNRKIRPIPKEVINAFLRPTYRPIASDNDAAIGNSFLFADTVIIPRRSVEFWEDVLAASVRFG